MEPAGSHGVWSLDDYQFVPFIWGSAQLAGKLNFHFSIGEWFKCFTDFWPVNAPIRPAQFLEENVINEYKDKYMFIGCIDYINKVKTGLFAEHSPQLWNISAVESWIKINTGLVKMYQKEVIVNLDYHWNFLTMFLWFSLAFGQISACTARSFRITDATGKSQGRSTVTIRTTRHVTTVLQASGQQTNDRLIFPAPFFSLILFFSCFGRNIQISM